MQVHCLGTAGYHPNEERHTSCYFLPKNGIVLDAGTGLFRLANLIETPTLDILLSHAHLDHIAGLTFLLDVLYQRPVERLRIWGQGEKLTAIREHLFSRLVFPVDLKAEWLEIDDLDEFQIGDCSVTWRCQDHPGMSVGYRMDWRHQPTQGPGKQGPGKQGPGKQGRGHRLLYLTDTTGDSDDEAIAWYSEADLMMHECYFPAESSEWALKTGHSWTKRVAEIARMAAPDKLLLTHINPLEADPKSLLREVEDSLGENPIPTVLAADRAVVDFGD